MVTYKAYTCLVDRLSQFDSMGLNSAKALVGRSERGAPPEDDLACHTPRIYQRRP